MGTRKIKVTRPFTYYLNGYEKRDFAIGEHDVPYDCAAYAICSGFTELGMEQKTAPEVKADGNKGANKPRRGKSTAKS